MRHGWWVGAVVVLLAGTAAQAETKKPAGGAAPRFSAVTLLIRHRVFHDFEDVQTLKLKQDFILGDTDYHAQVVQYVADFAMDLNTRKVVSKSDQPNNPGFKIIVFQGKVPQDTTWALLNMPPHFARKSFFAFRVVRVDFIGHEPILADTSASHDYNVRENPKLPKGMPLSTPQGMPHMMAPGAQHGTPPPMPPGHVKVAPKAAPAPAAPKDTTSKQ